MELRTIQDTKNFSKKICKIIKPGDIIFLCGELGVGKTALARFIINYLVEKNKNKDVPVCEREKFNQLGNYQ